MENEVATGEAPVADVLSFVLGEDWRLEVAISPLPLLGLLLAALFVWLILRWWFQQRLSDFEIDSATLGFGDQKLSLKPNQTDRQIAYAIWVELSTRKIGLPLDMENDVITEVYDSWHTYFGVTRELIKSIPASKVRADSTSKIIDLSIEVLNEGLRPHLTKWQARFRHWYEHELKTRTVIDPQDLQKQFPAYAELENDLVAVNQKLIVYRAMMKDLVSL